MLNCGLMSVWHWKQSFGSATLSSMFLVFADVNAVAAYAAHVVFGVGGALEVCVLTLVAAETFRVDFLDGGLGWIKDLGYIAAAIDVGLARPVATFAGDSGLAVNLRKLGMRIGSEALCSFFVAGCADFLTDKISRCRGGLAGFRAGGVGSLCGGSHCQDRKQARTEEKHEKNLGPENLSQSHIWCLQC